MNYLYTREGWPLASNHGRLFSSLGMQVAQVDGGFAYDRAGRYVGTVVRDRLIYRPTDSVRISSPFAPMIGSPFVVMRALPSIDLGSEPPIEH